MHCTAEQASLCADSRRWAQFRLALLCRFDGIGTDPSFVCERVCTSDRLSRRMGGLVKVCASQRMQCHAKGFATRSAFANLQDPVPNTCVTVCGTSGMVEGMHNMRLAPTLLTSYSQIVGCVAAADACTAACQQTVCTNMHQVPAWNDSCLQRCTAECLRSRSAQ